MKRRKNNLKVQLEKVSKTLKIPPSFLYLCFLPLAIFWDKFKNDDKSILQFLTYFIKRKKRLYIHFAFFFECFHSKLGSWIPSLKLKFQHRYILARFFELPFLVKDFQLANLKCNNTINKTHPLPAPKKKWNSALECWSYFFFLGILKFVKQ